MAKVRAASGSKASVARKGPATTPSAILPKAASKGQAKVAPASSSSASPTDALTFPPWVWIAVLTIATLAVFSPILRFPFLSWDDTSLVILNPWMHPVRWASFVHSWHYPLQDLYAPLTHNLYETLVLVSHAIHPGQGNAISPNVFRVASLLLHVGSVWLVFCLLRRLRFPGYAAFLGALLYAVHPLMVEAVSWIGGMDTVLSTFLCLLALWQYAIYAQEDQGGARRWMHLGAATLGYLLALFAKPGAVALPFMALVFEWLVFRRALRVFALPILAWVAMAIAWVYVTRTMQHVPAALFIPFWQRPFIAGDALAFYLVKLFAPFPMTIDYGRSPAHVLSHAWGFWTWLLPAALAIVAWRLYRRFPELAAGFGLMVAGTLPMLGLVPFAFQETSTVGDRYMYLAMVGPALALAAFAVRLRTQALYVVLSLLIVAAMASHIQTGFWRNSETIFRHSIAANPNSANVHNMLADMYMANNEPAKAEEEYRIASDLDPTQVVYFDNLANASRVIGNDRDAIDAYERAIALAPRHAKAYFGLGLVYAETGQTDLAAREWVISIQLSAANPDYHYNLGLALLRLGLYSDAAHEFRSVLVLQPGSLSAQYRLRQALQGERKLPAHADGHR